MKAYRIANWNDHYETAESRRIKALLWVATPNRHDSVGFCLLLRHPNGMAHYGAWNLILQVASKCSTRGLLTFGGKTPRPHTAATIANVSHGSQKVIEEVLPRLLELGWLEEVDIGAQQSAGQAQPIAGQATTTGREDMEEQEGRAIAATPTPREVITTKLARSGMSTFKDEVNHWLGFLHDTCGAEGADEACAAIGALAIVAEETAKPINYARQAQPHIAVAVRAIEALRKRREQGGAA